MSCVDAGDSSPGTKALRSDSGLRTVGGPSPSETESVSVEQLSHRERNVLDSSGGGARLRRASHGVVVEKAASNTASIKSGPSLLGHDWAAEAEGSRTRSCFKLLDFVCNREVEDTIESITVYTSYIYKGKY